MEAYIGEVRAFPYSFTPSGDTRWLLCDGASYQIQQFQALYSIIGTLYGGTPNMSFQVPDLRTRIAVGAGTGPGLPPVDVGEILGENNVILTLSQLPSHKHAVNAAFTGAATDLANQPDPGYAISRTFNQFDFSNEVLVNPAYLDPRTIEQKGLGSPHDNRQPVQAMTYFICYDGEYPLKP